MHRLFLLFLIGLIAHPVVCSGQDKQREAWLKNIYDIFKDLPRDTISKKILDVVDLQIYYKKVYQPVPRMPQPRVQWTQMLQVGKKYRRFIAQANIQADSVHDANTLNNTPVVESYLKWSATKGGEKVFEDIIFNAEKGSLTYHDRVFLDYYNYTEPIPQLEWTQLPGDTTIIGYTCHKASMRFRGRDYIAWYSEEIPMPYGPYKFGGLPGLILSLYDTDNDHHYTCIGIEHVKGKYIYEHLRGNEFSNPRKVIRRMKKNFCENPNSFRSPKIVRRNGPKWKPILYNPIELE